MCSHNAPDGNAGPSPERPEAVPEAPELPGPGPGQPAQGPAAEARGLAWGALRVEAVHRLCPKCLVGEGLWRRGRSP